MEKLENKYHEHIKKEKIKLTSNTIDFIGINIDLESEQYGIKTYYAPVSCIQYIPRMTNEILEYTTKCDMNRFFWGVRDEFRIREYIALKNRTDEKIEKLYRILAQYSYIKDNIFDIKRMSEMKITEQKDSKYAALYILGIKGEKNKPVFNFEWFTRNCPDPNDVGYMYTYNDPYFLEYLDEVNIYEYSILSKMARNLLNNYSKMNMHLWCFASDYHPDNYVKHKIYFKGDFENISFKEICATANLHIKNCIVSEMDEFKKYHNELILYGFAFCMDLKGQFSINCYFRIR